MFLYKFLRVFFYIPLRIIFPTKIINKKKLPKGKCIVTCNHLSGWDPILLGLRMSRPVGFIGKAELFKTKIANWFFTCLHCIPANRDGTDFVAIRKALEFLKKDEVFGIFPEGTRNREHTDTMLEVKNGACLFALKAKADIYPCIVKYPLKAFRKNYLIMGDPISFDNFKDRKVTTEVVSEATVILDQEMRKLQKKLHKTT